MEGWRRGTFIAVTLVALLAGCGDTDPGAADIIFTGGAIWTGDPARPRATALAVRDGRIQRVGDASDMAPLRGPGTREVELQGRTLLPGFVDSHTHFLSGGFQLSSVDLRDASSPEEFARRIGEFAESLDPGDWILGGDWDHEAWGGELPHRDWIDAVTPDNPVFVNRLDGHMALANTLALEAGDVTTDLPDPPGGTLVRDPATGVLTGVLKDEAMALVTRAVPQRSPQEWDRALEAASAHALSLGVTQVHDVDGWGSLEVYRRARAADALPLRIYAAVPMASWERMRELVAAEGRGDERLWWGGLKAFVDGSLGSTTAWFHEPYLDEPGTSGLITTDTAALRSWIVESDRAGLHAMVHAIGDRANDWLLDIYEGLEAANGPRDRRYRIEHAQHLTSRAIRRMGALGVVASMQPYHAADDGRWAEKRIGPERIRTTYAFRSLHDENVRLAFGSDWTVAPLDPLLGVEAALTRQTIDGANPDGWVPEERLGLEETLVAYTRNGSYAGFSDGFTGTLTPGKMADLVMLDGDIFSTPATEIADLRVEMTFVEGREVFTRGGGR